MEIQNCSDLPKHIVFDEILPKLHLSYLMKLRGVSKSWSLILFRFVIETLFPSDPHNDTSSDELIVKFVAKKTLPSLYRCNSFLTLSYDNLNLRLSFIYDYHDKTVNDLHLCDKFIGSVNGVVIYDVDPIGFYMWNPATNSQKRATESITFIPSPVFRNSFGSDFYGCGFCAQSRDIKVVSIRAFCYWYYPYVDEQELDFSDGSDDFVDEGNDEQEQGFSDASENMDGDNCDENEDFLDASDNMDGDNCDENEDFLDASDDFVDECENTNNSARTTRPAPVRDVNLLPDYLLEVYSTSTESWRQIVVDAQIFSQFPPDKTGFYPQRGYTNNDTYSWLVITHDVGDPPIVKLLTFHMNTEAFQVTSVPDAVLGGGSDYFSIPPDASRDGEPGRFLFQLLNGTIALFIPSLDHTSFEIWLLLEYGISDSWTRLCTIGPFPEIHRILGFWKNGNVILESTRGELLLADLFTNKIIRNLQIEGCPGFTQIIPHKETRIVLKGGDP